MTARLIRTLTLAAFALASVWCCPALAQISGGGVGQSGPVTAGDCAQWVGNGLIKDSGAGCGGGGGSGTVTSVSVATANGISGTVANPTTTPAITLTLGAITPSSVAIGAGSAITSSGPGGALASGAYANAYVLPAATNSTLGGVIPDGTIITVSGGGNITVPKATGAVFGVAECDGTTITCAAGVITAAAGAGPFLPLAGGTMVGTITAADASTYGSTGLTGLTALGMSGNITFTSGGVIAGVNGTPLNFTITAVGQTGANNGGNATLRGGNNSQASGTNSGGNVNITGGNASGSGSTGNGGNVNLTAGTSVGGTYGVVGVISSSFGLSGNITQPAWTTSGIRYRNVAATLTDTTSSGTVATAYTDLFGGNTIAATNATVYTNYYTSYFAGATASTNVTITNKYALGADSANLLTLAINGNAILTAPAAATLQQGAADAASPVAQTLQVQSATGTNTAAAANWNQQASLSTGTGLAGVINVMTGFKSLSENATITATSASPGVITYTAHGLVPGASGQFSNSGGALPTGISAATTYYVCKDANYVVNTFDISLTWSNGACGSLINTSSTGSGTNTFTTNTTVQNAASTVLAVGPSGNTGSQALSALAITQSENTSGNVNVLSVAASNIACGTCNLINLFGGAAGTTSEFSVAVNGTVSGAQYTATGTVGYTHSVNSNGTLNEVFGNTGSNAASIEQIQFKTGNATAIQGTITINGNSFSGGNGANAFTINGVTSLNLQGGSTNALTISSAQLVALPAIASDAALTDTTVCQDTTLHGLRAGSGTAGVCLGNVSSIRFKHDWQPLADGLSVMNALDPATYRYNEGIADGGTQLRVGFSAERYAEVLPQFTRYDSEGKPNGLDMLAAFPYAVNAIQQLDKRVRELEARR